MVQQGPWMANFIEHIVPEWNNPAVAQLDKKDPDYQKKFDELTAAYYKLPSEKRQEMATWGVAPFPSVFSDALSGADLIDKGVTFCGFDVLVIPKGAKHPREAFEFVAYVNRQAVMEKLCRLHCKNSPLAQTSPDWVRTHPNPYIEMFDRIADSPRARTVPSLPIWPEVDAEMQALVDRVTLVTQTPTQALAQANTRLQRSLDQFNQRQAARGKPVTEVTP
jgi:ABC-type glycerol-3-phosphate transport system substrate-binding protein